MRLFKLLVTKPILKRVIKFVRSGPVCSARMMNYVSELLFSVPTIKLVILLQTQTWTRDLVTLELEL